ncbi:hypothetical protein [Terricaulis sp.]|uniref:hypothetical protein n=1 Tax=Terricaulis sp. TaxID=2768686 RepID=UPI0037840C63
MRHALIALFAAVSIAGAAHAQQPDANLAAARAIVERAQLEDVFTPLADDHISVRHAASGLVCHFSAADTRSDVVVFGSSLPRGDDVGCVRDREGQAVTLYATRYDQPVRAEDALAAAETAIRRRFADAQPTPATLTMNSEALPPTLVAHYLITLGGERWLTTAAVAQSGAWIIKLRFSSRAADSAELRQAELEANALMTLALLEIARASGTD